MSRRLVEGRGRGGAKPGGGGGGGGARAPLSTTRAMRVRVPSAPSARGRELLAPTGDWSYSRPRRARPGVLLTPSAGEAYQTVQIFSGLIAAPCLQAKASLKEGKLESGPRTLYLGSECGLTVAMSFMYSGEAVAHQPWA